MAKRKFVFMNFMRDIFNKVFPEIIPNNYLYDNMDDAIECWLSLYYDEPAWLKENHGKSLNLPAQIAAEFARLIMIEFDVEVTGSPRAEFIQTQFKRTDLRTNLEEACAVGGLVFKPYVKNGLILTDCITQDRFIPIEFNGEDITGAVFINQITKGKNCFFRIEKQTYSYETRSHRIESKFFVSESPDKLGKEIDVSKYPEEIDPDYTINDVDCPLFSFWRVPLANTIDKESPLGVSVYSRAVKHIKEADKQWDRFLWEYEGGELAIDADESALRTRPIITSNGKEKIRVETPKTKDRLFRRVRGRNKDETPFYNTFAPVLRDSSYANGLDKIMRKIEFACALGYGTISEPQNVDKTAEEVKNSKQRSFAVINNMQQTLQSALERYLYAIDQYTTACNLAPTGNYEVKWNWGDGVLEDNDKETQVRMQEVNSGITDKVEYLKWRYGVTEKQALEMMPKESGVVDFFHDEEGG